MLLKNLIKDIPIKNKKINVKGLAIDSKKIKKDYIFFAIKGFKFDGEKYISEAVKKGASVIICSRKCKYKNEKILIIKTSNIRNYLSQIASKFFQLKPKNIIAVTGTGWPSHARSTYLDSCCSRCWSECTCIHHRMQRCWDRR
mgnify:CR=1 FL=1